MKLFSKERGNHGRHLVEYTQHFCRIALIESNRLHGITVWWYYPTPVSLDLLHSVCEKVNLLRHSRTLRTGLMIYIDFHIQSM